MERWDMMTTVYLIRHSIKEKNYNIVNSNDSEQVIDEKEILSIEGEEKAKLLSENIELQNIDEIWSSNYVRTQQTAKYICKNNNQYINISSSFDERHYGTFCDNINKEQFEDFWIGQFKDLNLKNSNGESGLEVCNRIDMKINEIISNNKDKRVAIVGHNASIIFYLLKYCRLVNAEATKKLTISFNDKNLIQDSIMKSPSFFKLQFDDNNNLVDLSYHTID